MWVKILMLESYEEKLEKLIIRHEGERAKPYKCTGLANTIGRGYNFDANPLPRHIREFLKRNGFITKDMIVELYNISIEQAEGDCMRLFPEFETFSDDRRMALTDFVFQLGYTRASKFIHAITAVNTGRWEDAAAHMRDSNWARQTPNRAKEITELIEVG